MHCSQCDLGLISPTSIHEDFTLVDPKSAKRQSSHLCFFALLWSLWVKVACKMVVKSTSEATCDKRALNRCFDVEIFEWSYNLIAKYDSPKIEGLAIKEEKVCQKHVQTRLYTSKHIWTR